MVISKSDIRKIFDEELTSLNEEMSGADAANMISLLRDISGKLNKLEDLDVSIDYLSSVMGGGAAMDIELGQKFLKRYYSNKRKGKMDEEKASKTTRSEIKQITKEELGNFLGEQVDGETECAELQKSWDEAYHMLQNGSYTEDQWQRVAGSLKSQAKNLVLSGKVGSCPMMTSKELDITSRPWKSSGPGDIGFIPGPLEEEILEEEQLRGPQVMVSAAGYYVGYEYYDEEFGFWGPYDRVTGYYASEGEAQAALEDVMAGDMETRSSAMGQSGDYIGDRGSTLHEDEKHCADNEYGSYYEGSTLVHCPGRQRLGQKLIEIGREDIAGMLPGFGAFSTSRFPEMERAADEGDMDKLDQMKAAQVRFGQKMSSGYYGRLDESMKTTKEQLKQLIKEELKAYTEEASGGCEEYINTVLRFYELHSKVSKWPKDWEFLLGTEGLNEYEALLGRLGQYSHDKDFVVGCDEMLIAKAKEKGFLK